MFFRNNFYVLQVSERLWALPENGEWPGASQSNHWFIKQKCLLLKYLWDHDVLQKRNDRTKPLKRSRYESSSRQEKSDFALNFFFLQRFLFYFSTAFSSLIETFRNDQSGCLCFASKARKGSAGWKRKCETMRWLKMKPHNVKQCAGWRKTQIDTNCSQLKCTTTATMWNLDCTVCNIFQGQQK